MEHEVENGVHWRIEFWYRVPQCTSNMPHNCIGNYSGPLQEVWQVAKRPESDQAVGCWAWNFWVAVKELILSYHNGYI